MRCDGLFLFPCSEKSAGLIQILLYPPISSVAWYVSLGMFLVEKGSGDH